MRIWRVSALFLALAGCNASTAVSGGRPAADFQLQGLDGNPVSLAAARGKVALVDFWASWCVPCREELPALEKLRRDYEPRGVAILTVNLDSDRQAAADMAKRLGVTLPVGLDPEKRVASAWQLPTMPTSYLVDRRGTIRYEHQGFFGAADVERFRRELDELLAQP